VQGHERHGRACVDDPGGGGAVHCSDVVGPFWVLMRGGGLGKGG
jgi:hypothetical protein